MLRTLPTVALVLAATARPRPPSATRADVAAVLACRRLVQGPGRQACFERTTAELESQLASAEGRTATATAGVGDGVGDGDAGRPPSPAARAQDVAAPAMRRTAAAARLRSHPAPRRPASSREAFEAVAVKVSYDDQAPVFELDDGQVWASSEPRRISFHGDGTDLVRIVPAPGGWLLHLRGSYWGLPVVRRR